MAFKKNVCIEGTAEINSQIKNFFFLKFTVSVRVCAWSMSLIGDGGCPS